MEKYFLMKKRQAKVEQLSLSGNASQDLVEVLQKTIMSRRKDISQSKAQSKSKIVIHFLQRILSAGDSKKTWEEKAPSCFKTEKKKSNCISWK